jgi:hypothetical protein
MAATITKIALLSVLVLLTTTSSASAQSMRRAANRLVSTAIGNAVRQTVGNANGAVRQNGMAQGGTANGAIMLPNVSTASVDLNTCDMDFIGGKSRPSAGPGGGGSGGGSNGGVDTTGYPPKPGPDYQPMTQHGEFVGWYSPEEVALSQTDFPAALVSILKSDRYYGGISGAASILYEIGMISDPFDFAAAAAFLGK